MADHPQDENSAPNQADAKAAIKDAASGQGRAGRGGAARGLPAQDRQARPQRGGPDLDLGDRPPRRARHGRQAQPEDAADAEPEGRLRLPELRLARSGRRPQASPSSARTAPRRSPARRRGKRITPEFFAAARDRRAARAAPNSGSDQQGRLTQPMVLPARRRPLRADRVGRRVRADRRRAERARVARTRRSFYTSGRTSNEAAFLYQLFVAPVRHQQPARLLEHVPRVERPRR